MVWTSVCCPGPLQLLFLQGCTLQGAHLSVPLSWLLQQHQLRQPWMRRGYTGEQGPPAFPHLPLHTPDTKGYRRVYRREVHQICCLGNLEQLHPVFRDYDLHTKDQLRTCQKQAWAWAVFSHPGAGTWHSTLWLTLLSPIPPFFDTGKGWRETAE